MPDDTSTNLEHQVDRHERELELDGKDIEKLKKEIAALKHDVGGLIEILGLFRAVPYFQANILYPEEKEKRDAIVAPPPRTLSSRTVLGTLFFSLGYLILGEPASRLMNRPKKALDLLGSLRPQVSE